MRARNFLVIFFDKRKKKFDSELFSESIGTNLVKTNFGPPCQPGTLESKENFHQKVVGVHETPIFKRNIKSSHKKCVVEHIFLLREVFFIRGSL